MFTSKHWFSCLVVVSSLLWGGHANAQTTRIVTLVDSNTAGFGVADRQAFPAQSHAAHGGAAPTSRS